MNTPITSGSPLTIESIFCHAFSVTLETIQRFWPHYAALVLASLMLSQGISNLGILATILVLVAIGCAGCLLTLATIYTSARIWQGQPISSTGEIFRLIDLMLIFECVWLLLRIWLTVLPLLLLLIIPGFVYLFNRTLSLYCLVLRRTTVSEALKESRALMTCEPWYATSGPQLRLAGLLFILLLCSVGIEILSVTGSGIQVLASLWFPGEFTRTLDWTGSLADLMARQFFTVFQIAVSVGFYLDMKNRTAVSLPASTENR